MLLVTGVAAAAAPIASPWTAGDTWQASGSCGGSYYGEDAHTNLSAFSIDFNRYPSCQSDAKYPIVACAAGRVVYRQVGEAVKAWLS